MGGIWEPQEMFKEVGLSDNLPFPSYPRFAPNCLWQALVQEDTGFCSIVSRAV